MFDSREVDYRGLLSCRCSQQRSDKRQMNFFNFFFQFFFPIFILFNFIERPTIGDRFLPLQPAALYSDFFSVFSFSSSIFSEADYRGSLSCRYSQQRSILTLFSVFSFSFLQFFSEANYRGFFLANDAFGGWWFLFENF